MALYVRSGSHLYAFFLFPEILCVNSGSCGLIYCELLSLTPLASVSSISSLNPYRSASVTPFGSAVESGVSIPRWQFVHLFPWYSLSLLFFGPFFVPKSIIMYRSIAWREFLVPPSQGSA